MVYHASSLKSLRDAINSFISVLGENTRVGSLQDDLDGSGEYADNLLTLHIAFVDKNGIIVGTESEDYKPKTDEFPVVLIS